MRNVFAGLLTLSILWMASAVQARDTEYKLRIDEVLQDPEFKDRLGGDVDFYFGDQRTPKIGKAFGEFVSQQENQSVWQAGRTGVPLGNALGSALTPRSRRGDGRQCGNKDYQLLQERYILERD